MVKVTSIPRLRSFHFPGGSRWVYEALASRKSMCFEEDAPPQKWVELRECWWSRVVLTVARRAAVALMLVGTDSYGNRVELVRMKTVRTIPATHPKSICSGVKST